MEKLLCSIDDAVESLGVSRHQEPLPVDVAVALDRWSIGLDEQFVVVFQLHGVG